MRFMCPLKSVTRWWRVVIAKVHNALFGHVLRWAIADVGDIDLSNTRVRHRQFGVNNVDETDNTEAV